MRTVSAPVDTAVEHYGLNETGKDFVVGDIHGCFTKLQKKLDEIGFDETKDRLFSVGDLLDRGKECHLATEWIKKPWFHAVRGNHEDMALQNRTLVERDPLQICLSYYDQRNGMEWWAQHPYAVRRDLFLAIRKLPIAIDVMTKKGLVGIVHSQVVPTYQTAGSFHPVYNWSEFVIRLSTHRHEVAEEVMWQRDICQYNINVNVEGCFRVYAGHTPMDTPKVLGNMVFIDTGACFEQYADEGFGHFTIMELTQELDQTFLDRQPRA